MKPGRVVMAVAVAALVGSLIGAPLANAVASLVTIQGAGTSNKAKVDGTGHLFARTDAGTSSVFAISEPGGETVIACGSSNLVKSTGSSCGDIVGVNLDVSSAGTQPVTITLRKGNSQGSGQIIWQGTVPTGVGHLDYAWDQSILICPHTGSGFNVTVANTGGATLTYQLYGFGFGVQCCTIADHRAMRR
jgi:hypothetical protein